jgi:hypothetical protein
MKLSEHSEADRNQKHETRPPVYSITRIVERCILFDKPLKKTYRGTIQLIFHFSTTFNIMCVSAL